MKSCEKCNIEIPEDFGNLLCPKCYDETVIEIDRVNKQEQLDREAEQKRIAEAGYNVNGITDPEYKENPEMEDKNQVMANIAQFQHSGKLLWGDTRNMYEFIKNWCMGRTLEHPQYPKYIWRPTIVDVGCGSGVGSNVLSQEADMVWGIDKNKNSVDFAKEAFTRVKNGIYYSSQVSFDQVDILEDRWEFMKFEVVVAIEIIEHVFDYKKFLEALITKFDTRNKDWPTTYFISTPNRNSLTIQKDHPKNPYHVREWKAQEFHAELSRYFNDVKIIDYNFTLPVQINKTPSDADIKAIINFGNFELPINTTITPILARCTNPKI